MNEFALYSHKSLTDVEVTIDIAGMFPKQCAQQIILHLEKESSKGHNGY